MKKLALFVVILLLLSPLIFAYGTVSHETIIVTHRERVTKGDSSYYLVYTDGGTTYQVVDSWLFLKFNSSDTYGRLGNGMHNVKVNGIRFGFFSWYKNILAVE